MTRFIGYDGYRQTDRKDGHMCIRRNKDRYRHIRSDTDRYSWILINTNRLMRAMLENTNPDVIQIAQACKDIFMYRGIGIYLIDKDFRGYKLSRGTGSSIGRGRRPSLIPFQVTVF